LLTLVVDYVNDVTSGWGYLV